VTANASNSGVQALFIFMLSVALYSRQCSSKAWRCHKFLFYFLIDEMQSSQRKCSLGLVKLSQQPVTSFKFEVY
jgi:hypothetical protein